MATLLRAPATRAASDRGTYTYIAVFSAVLYTVLLIAPVIGGKLTAQFHLTPSQLGLLFSAELGAFSLATVPAYLWLTKLNLRTASYLFTGIVIAGNVVSGFVDSYALLIVARVITSLAAGSITVIILSLSGKTANPSRAFGFFVVFQLVMGAIILAVFPALYANTGVAAIYWTLAGLAVVCLFFVRCIDGEALRSGSGEPRSEASAAVVPSSARIPVGKFVVGLAGVLMFYIALSGIWSFMAAISTGSGTSLSATSVVLSAATVAGIVSALVATVLGDSPRRKAFLLLGYLGMAVSVGLLFGGPGLVRFAVAAVIFKFAWTFILPYLLSSLSDLSSNGHVMNTTNLMIGTGFAIGPIVSGNLIESSGGFTGMLVLGLVGVLASLVCAMVIQRRRSMR
ncbi:MFS transporter [Specibacter cremeus]|uniref:MFS transporter n=1 Tax=Specibacter cremeus TaxID=1629051 RepID=UPI000F792997|nr:MFS transporter [Specibacter cremeus]